MCHVTTNNDACSQNVTDKFPNINTSTTASVGALRDLSSQDTVLSISEIPSTSYDMFLSSRYLFQDSSSRRVSTSTVIEPSNNSTIIVYNESQIYHLNKTIQIITDLPNSIREHYTG